MDFRGITQIQVAASGTKDVLTLDLGAVGVLIFDRSSARAVLDALQTLAGVETDLWKPQAHVKTVYNGSTKRGTLEVIP